MAQIKNFHNQKIDRKKFHAELLEAVKNISAKYGLTVKGGVMNLKVNSAAKRFQFFAAKDEQQVANELSAGEILANNYLRKYNLAVGDIIAVNGENFKITGWKANRPKFPVSILRMKDNVKQKCTPNFAQTHKRF